MSLILDGTIGVQGNSGAFIADTAKASTSGTTVDFTGIPSWVKRITVMFSGVSTNGSSVPLIQLGDSGGIETTGYLGTGSTATVYTNYTAGFGVAGTSGAARVYHGSLILSLIGSNNWACFGVTGLSDQASTSLTGGTKTLSDTLTQVRITTVNGTDTFDAGTINILYE
jgi:hypothetical protein